MIDLYKQLIQISNSLNTYQQNKMIDILDKLSKRTGEIEAKNNSLKEQLNLIAPKKYNDHLQKSIDILKLFGFNEITFEGLLPSFLNWLIEVTTPLTTYKPKLMNYYLLHSLQEAYMIKLVNIDGRQPTYNEVVKLMLTFDDEIEKLKKELNLSLPELINKINGTD